MRLRARSLALMLIVVVGAVGCSTDQISEEIVPTSGESVHDTTTTTAANVEEGVSGTIFESPDPG